MSIHLTARSTPALENTANGFGAGQIEVVLTLSAPSQEEVSVQYRLRDQTAGDDDLLYLSSWFRNFGTLRFDAGETEKTIFVETRPDSRVESDEAFAVEFYNPVGAAFEGGGPLLQSLAVILDDDGDPAPSLFVSDPLVVADEATADIRFDIHLSRPSDVATVLSYETFSLLGQPVTGTLTIVAGETLAVLTLPVSTGALPAGLNHLGIKVISDAADSRPVFSQATVLVPATSDLPTLAVLGDAGLENVGPVDGRLSFTLVLSDASTDPVTVEYYLSGGSADDLDLDTPFWGQTNTGTVTFAPGETVATVHVALQTDSGVERDEAFTFHAVNPQGAIFAGGAMKASAIGVVLDNEAALLQPSLFIKDAQIRDTASGPVAEFVLSLSRPWSEDATLDFSTQNGTALAGSDYDSTTGTIVIEAGQTRAEVQVPISAGPEDDSSGRFLLNATLSSETLVGHPTVTGQAHLGAYDASLLPVAKVSGLDMVWIEGQDNTARFTVTLSQPPSEAVDLPYTIITNGPHDPTQDGPLAASGTVRFEAGQTHKIIDIALDADATPMVDTGLWLELFDPSGARLDPAKDGAQALSVIRAPIQDAATPQLFLTQSALKHKANGDQFVVLELRLSQPTETPLSVDYTTHDGSALSGQDYTGIAGTIQIDAGQDTAFVTVPVTQTGLGAVAKTLMVAAQINGADDPVWADLTLPHDTTSGLPTVSVTGSSVFENKGLGSNELPFTVHLSQPSSEGVSVQYEAFHGTTDAADLAEPLMAGTLFFQPGQTRITLPFTTQFETIAEADETLFLRLTTPEFAVLDRGQDQLVAVGFVLDDDGPALPAIAASDVTLSEGGAVRIPLHLSQAMDADMTIVVTAFHTMTSAADIAALPANVTFLAGQTTAYLTVLALNDGISEGDETLSLTLLQVTEGDQTPISTKLSVKIIDAQNGAPDVPVIRSGTDQPDVLAGGAFGDTLTGAGGNDQLFGHAGDDFFLPGAGSDVISGGDGVDTISFVDAIQGVAIDMVSGRAVSGADTDIWTGVENIAGSIHSDFVLTDDGANRIRALGNYDWIVGSDGFDFIDGGAGRDMLSYVYAPDSVVVDLGAGRGLEGQALGDRFVSIERLTGSIYSDRFLGSDGEDDFRGLGGDDWFVGSNGGRDRYDGGNGRDTVAYDLATSRVTASLTKGVFGEGQAALDLFTSIENLTGSSFNDLLIGDSGRNTLRGLYGADHLDGRGGNDHLIGGALDDLLDGGAGWDVAVFQSIQSDYRVTQVGSSVQVQTLGTSKEGTDTLISIEAIQFADGLVYL